MRATMVPTKGLPPIVRQILDSVGFHRPDIGIEASETFRFQGAYGDGYRAFAVLFNLSTGERRDMQGSWGGASPNYQSRVDSDREPHPIPPNFAVILGQEGGGRPVSASLVVRPDAVTPLLPAAPTDVTDRERRILAVVRSYKAAFRKETLRGMRVTDEEISALVGKGYLTKNSAGAIGITTAGKNAAGRV